MDFKKDEIQIFFINSKVKTYLTPFHDEKTIIDIMPIQQIAPIVRVQQAKLEKERHDIETVLQGQIFKI